MPYNHYQNLSHCVCDLSPKVDHDFAQLFSILRKLQQILQSAEPTENSQAREKLQLIQLEEKSIGAEQLETAVHNNPGNDGKGR